jgi:hypothetical protein
VNISCAYSNTLCGHWITFKCFLCVQIDLRNSSGLFILLKTLVLLCKAKTGSWILCYNSDVSVQLSSPFNRKVLEFLSKFNPRNVSDILWFDLEMGLPSSLIIFRPPKNLLSVIIIDQIHELRRGLLITGYKRVYQVQNFLFHISADSIEPIQVKCTFHVFIMAQ